MSVESVLEQFHGNHNQQSHGRRAGGRARALLDKARGRSQPAPKPPRKSRGDVADLKPRAIAEGIKKGSMKARGGVTSTEHDILRNALEGEGLAGYDSTGKLIKYIPDPGADGAKSGGNYHASFVDLVDRGFMAVSEGAGPGAFPQWYHDSGKPLGAAFVNPVRVTPDGLKAFNRPRYVGSRAQQLYRPPQQEDELS